jgi:hypothetical protein
MPAVRLSDLARMRVEVISFFLVVFLASSAVVCVLWNWLRKDFSRLPRLSFVKACGVVGLWGLLFVVVLTMISGARELMTPGAWVLDGATYKLRDAPQSEENKAFDESERRQRLERLSAELTAFADTHDGRFPTRSEFEELPGDIRHAIGLPGVQFAYVPDLNRLGDVRLLAFEPVAYGSELLILLTDGAIRRASNGEIDDLQPGKVP